MSCDHGNQHTPTSLGVDRIQVDSMSRWWAIAAEVSTHPFGALVLPEENWMNAVSSGPGGLGDTDPLSANDSIAVARGYQVFAKNAFTGGAADIALGFGRSSDTRIVGDFFGSGTDTPAVVR